MAQRRVSVVLDAAVSGFQRGMQQAQRQTQSFGQSLERNAGNLTRLGLGMTAASAVMVAGMRSVARETAEFDLRIMRLTTLVGIAEDEAQSMGQAMMGLGETGRGPQELSEALFFVTSAGQRGAEAMGTVEAAARAAAIGLGDTATIADLATSAMNAYGPETLSAAEATDFLAGAVRAGKLEAETLAPVMGRILPTAAALGIAFEDVAGSMAVMSRTGADAAEISTTMVAIMSTLLKPTDQAAGMLDSVGLSMGQLRDMAGRPGGLVEVMRTLASSFEGNDEALATVVPNVRAFRGVMNVLAQDSEVVDQVMGDVAGSVGLVDEAFEQWGTTTEAAQRRFSAALEAAKITAGEDFQPVMRSLLNTGTSLAEKFVELDPRIRQFGSTAAMVGAGALGLSGSMLTTAGSAALLVSSLKNMGVTASTVMGPLRGMGSFLMGPWGVAIAVATSALVFHIRRQQEVADAAERLNRILETQEGSVRDNTREWVINELQQRDVLTALQDAGLTVDDMTSALAGNTAAQERVNEAVKSGLFAYGDYIGMLPGVRSESRDLSMTIEDLTAAYERQTETQAALDREQRQSALADGSILDATFDLLGGTHDLAGGMEGLAGSTDQATSSLSRHRDQLTAMSDPIFAVMRAADDLEQAQRNLIETQQDGEASADDLAEAERDLAQAAIELLGRMGELDGALEDGTLTVDGLRSALQPLVDSGLIPQSVFDRLIGDFDETTGMVWDYIRATDNVPPDLRTVIRLQGADGAIRDAVSLARHLQSINRTWRARIEVSGARVPPGVEIRHGGGRVGVDPASTMALSSGIQPNERLILAEVGERVVTEQQWHAMQAPNVQVMHSGGTVGGGGFGGGGLTINLTQNVHGSLLTNQQAADMMGEAIVEKVRRKVGM